MNETHLDIFSGIGGFALAARGAGFRTVAFCESDSRCREFLGKTWGLPVEPDIRKLDGRNYRGVTLLTGGPPCQPASRAGKQGGEKDDRWLWGEALRVLGEALPNCCLFENPPGILDVGIDGILSEMGRLGYETQCFDIPACAVDSPQLRHRIWIIGFLSDAARNGRGKGGTESIETRRTGLSEHSFDVANVARHGEGGIRKTARADRERVGQPCQQDSGSVADTNGEKRERLDDQSANMPDAQRRQEPFRSNTASYSHQSLVADTERKRRERRSAEPREAEGRQSFSPTPGLHWSNAIWVPCADGKLRRAPDDSFSVVNGLHRSILGALGNSICSQVATEILKAMRQSL